VRRREFVTLLGGAAASRPLAARAQQPGRIRTIGFLAIETEAGSTPWLDGLRDGLHELGYFEGKNIAFEFRYAGGEYERLPQLAAELLSTRLM
jgi:putative tryptophan/tyrosine transport system substrate-binding protein